MRMIYEERYGFNPKTVFVLLIAAVFVAGAIFAPGVSAGQRYGTFFLCGGGGLLMLAGALSRKVALRVDEAGITLGGRPPRYRTTTQQIQWADVEAVVLWRQHGAVRYPWIGVLRRTDTPSSRMAPTGSGSGALLSAASGLVGVPDERLLKCAKGINGWKLDANRLAATLQAVAPRVPLIDHR